MLDGYKPDIIWASPPCQQFSVASIGKYMNFNNGYLPVDKPTIEAIKLVKKTVEIISVLQPKYLYIENPRAMLRKLELIPFPYSTVSYCQYGFKNMKPTDIWHNNPNWAKEAKFCGRGQPCHESAPRGSKTGTQGLKNAKERARIPPRLIEEILDYSKWDCTIG